VAVRDSVSVVVVSRRHDDRLALTLKALERDGLRANTVVANVTGSAINAPTGVTVVDIGTGASLSEAVALAIGGLATETLWILRDDTTPREGAFAALCSVLDTSPSAGIVGPKQLDANNPGEILEMGESLSLSGRSVPLAERELDQGQYDRSSDVLAVGEAGMLVRREVWERLDGFDPSLPVVDGALDFCFRARTAGWRVQVVPTAAIDATDTSLEALLGEVSAGREAYEYARAWAFRLLATAALWSTPFIAVAIVVGSFVRGVGRVMVKKPSPFAELSGALTGLIRVGALSASRRRRAATTTQSIGGTALYVTRAEMARRRALERDAELAAREELDSTPRLGFGHLGVWLTVAAALVGAVLYRNLFGAEAVAGGGLAPLDQSFANLWRAVGATWSEAAGGIVSAPDGFAALVALIGSVTWWSPSTAVVALWLLAIPMSFVAAWVATGAFHTSSLGAALTATVWSLLPTLHIALGEGRLGAVLAHILIPLAVRALLTSGAVSAAWFALLAAALWVSVPALAPLVLVAVIVRTLTGRPWFVLTVVPALALEWPRIIEAIATSPLRYFADRGVPTPTLPTDPSSLGIWPQIPEIPFIDGSISAIVFWSFAGCLLASTVWVIVAGNTRLGLMTAIGSLAVLWATMLSPLSLASIDGNGVGLFIGPLVDLLWLAGAIGFGRAVSLLPSVLRLVSVPVVAAVAALSVVSIAAPFLVDTAATASRARTVPAYVEAETNSREGAGTLVISIVDDTVVAEVRRDSGTTLSDWTASAATRTVLGGREDEIATLAGNLIVESGFDVVSAAKELNLAFILLDAEPSSPEVSAISSHPGLAQVGVTDLGILWTVIDSAGESGSTHPRNVGYLVLAGLVGLVTFVLAIPTTLPRRRRIEDDLAVVAGEENG
jgi:hypothetical protein